MIISQSTYDRGRLTDDVEGETESGCRLDGGYDGSSAATVPPPLRKVSAISQTQAAAVEGGSFTEENHWPLVLLPAAVADLNEAGRLTGAASHCQEGCEPDGLHPVPVSDIHLNPAGTQVLHS